jgi:NADP-dependent 3-hydroxy acid dehydrogenase YdfG
LNFEHSVAIITGASMGIGAATARAFAEAGVKVVLAARSAERLSMVAREIGTEHALAIPTDITVRAQVDMLVQRAIDHFGRVDILVNNAALGLENPVATLDAANLELIFQTNVLGPLYAIQAVIPHMCRQTGGLIINVSSMVARLPIPGIGGYRATKKALDALSESARIELACENIRIVTVYPGVTATNFFDSQLGQSEKTSVSRLKRPPDTPEFVAEKIVQAARREPRELFVRPVFRLIALITAIFPGWFERIMLPKGT